MKETRLASKVIHTLIKDSLHYPNKLVLSAVGIIVRCGVLLILYGYVYQLNNGAINGTTYLYAAWSILFYFLFLTLGLRNIARLIMQDVQSGNVEVLFSKPVTYILYRVWWQIGSGLYSFLVITPIAIILLFLIIGIPPTMMNYIFLPTFLLTFLLASILSLLIYSIVGLLAFWIEDINPVFWIVDKAVMILGGSYLPVALFPPIMYKIALYSPFGASQFITHTVSTSWASNWYQLITIQIIWILALLVCVYFMFNKAKQQVSVNGG